MLPDDAGDLCEGRTAADDQTVRNVYVIGPHNQIKLVIAYPMTTGRNFDEQARELYPAGWQAPRPYLRIVPQPGQ